VLPELEPDEFYLADLVGCVARDSRTSAPVGSVTAARALPASTVLTIVFTAGGGEVLVPLIDDAVPQLDVDAGWVDLDLTFLDVDASGSVPS
jgi:16S rRNA processing protein RimM